MVRVIRVDVISLRHQSLNLSLHFSSDDCELPSKPERNQSENSPVVSSVGGLLQGHLEKERKLKTNWKNKPCFQGFQAFVAGLLFQTADCRVASSGQGHCTQHQAGYGLHCQHIQLSPLQVLLETKAETKHWDWQQESSRNISNLWVVFFLAIKNMKWHMCFYGYLLLRFLLLVQSDWLGDQHPQQGGPGLFKLSPAAPAWIHVD